MPPISRCKDAWYPIEPHASKQFIEFNKDLNLHKTDSIHLTSCGYILQWRPLGRSLHENMGKESGFNWKDFTAPLTEEQLNMMARTIAMQLADTYNPDLDIYPTPMGPIKILAESEE